MFLTCFVWQVLQSEIPLARDRQSGKKAIKDIQGNRGHREITSTSIERVMFKLFLFNVLNGQRFACSEIIGGTWQCVPGVVDRGEVIMI